MNDRVKSYGQEFKEKYKTRASLVKMGMIEKSKKEYAQAAFKFQEYLSLIARYHDVPIIDLRPELFDNRKEIAEILMISQVTWELLKIYENVPKLEVQFRHCIEIFVRFSINQPFQQLNAEMLRRYIRKSRLKDKELLREAYKKVQLKSRQCFIATYCYGNDHPITKSLRLFKFRIQERPLGYAFVDWYYRVSPKLINIMNNKKWLRSLSLPIAKTFLIFFERIVRK